MSKLQQITDQASQSQFDKKVLSTVQFLHPYVKHRLYIAIARGILPKNMYSSNGIIDDCIIRLYDEGFDIDADPHLIKLYLFQFIDEHLNALFKKEAFHKNTLSTSALLKKEMESLDESFTVDGDIDYVMNEDLNDISYHQDQNSNAVFVYADKDSVILNAMDVSNQNIKDSKKYIGKFYNWLPLRTANIVDLYIFGHLSYEDIAKIKQIEVSRVEKIMTQVKLKFRTHLE
mgnify:CR=1 FL=1